MSIYFDNSATTKPCKKAVDKALYMMNECYGNPSSLHMCGYSAKKELDSARKTVADFLSCSPNEIYFTGSGTIANNTAILGTARAKKRDGKKIITTRLEHPAVIKHFELLEELGYEAVYLTPDKNGIISLDELYNACDEQTILVSVMAVNNEVGSIQQFDKIKNVIKSKGSNALYHCDAVQGFGKIDIKPKKAGIDLMSMSGHKIHGLKGCGALYISSSVKIKPSVLGGGQENGMVSGTEPMPNICAFAEAVSDIGSLNDNLNRVNEINNYFTDKLKSIEGVYVNSPSNAIPYIVNVSVMGVPSQVMLNSLSSMGIYVSAGSACSKGHRSNVLEAMGIEPKRIDSALRISFSRYNTKEEIDALCDGIISTINRVRR